MKRQFKAGAAAKREVKKLQIVIGNKNDSIVKTNNLVSNLHGVVDRWTNDYEKLQGRYYDLIANNKANVMRLENEQKQALQQWKEEKAKLVEDVDFYKSLYNLVDKYDKEKSEVLLKQSDLIKLQEDNFNHLQKDYFRLKKSRENLFSLLFSLIISIIILLVW